MTLEQRVDALERELAELRAGHGGLVPSTTTFKADGTVGADYSGHISAAGLDLLAGSSGSPPDDRKVRWLRQQDGIPVAELQAYSLLPGPATWDSYARFLARSSGAHTGRAEMAAFDNAGDVYVGARLFVESDVAGTVPKRAISVDVDNETVPPSNIYQATILDSSNQSDFLRGPREVLYTSFAGSILGGVQSFNINFPHKVMTNARGGGGLLLVEISCFTDTAGTRVIVGFGLDGNFTHQSHFFFNQANVHMMIPVVGIPLSNVGAGNHTLDVRADFWRPMTDGNDTVRAWLFS